MEKGFYHPARGYWQSVSEVPQDILDGYPEGTIEVPVKPGANYDFIGGAWVPVAPPAPTPEDVTAERDRRIKALAAGYTPTERETWSTQVSEARAVLADPAAATPMLSPMAAARGVTVAQLAARVVGLSDGFAAGTGAIMAAGAVLAAQDPIPADFAYDRHWS